MADLTCDAGQIAISDMITAINTKISATDYATTTTAGTIKVRLDETNPDNIILYMTNDGTNP